MTTVMCLLVSTGLVDDFTMEPMIDSPEEGIGWYSMMVAIMLTSTICSSRGAQMCPAALSATLNTGTNIVCSYVADIIIFGSSVKMQSLFGAGLMLVSLCLMATSRVNNKQNDANKTAAAATLSDLAVDDSLSVSSSVSLSSFVSAEFAVTFPESVHDSLHARRPKATPGAATAQTIGHGMSVATGGG